MLPEGNDRLLVETVLSMLTVVSHFKKGLHRVWVYVPARLAFTMAACDVLGQWHGFVPLSLPSLICIVLILRFHRKVSVFFLANHITFIEDVTPIKGTIVCHVLVAFKD
jgi:hypothetical protein